jgi:serine/threonine protein kinase
VKVLDFGLAKALDPVASAAGDVMASPTMTRLRQGYGEAGETEFGVILGTAAYMSPEQAKGRQADKRSDVWAFGAVLYDMLSGQRAFKGEDMADTLAAVLRQDITGRRSRVDARAVRRLLARCLDGTSGGGCATSEKRGRAGGSAASPAEIGWAGDAAPLATRDSGRALRDRDQCAHWNRRLVSRPQTVAAARGTRLALILPEGQRFRRPVSASLDRCRRRRRWCMQARAAVCSIDVPTGRQRDSRH